MLPPQSWPTFIANFYKVKAIKKLFNPTSNYIVYLYTYVYRIYRYIYMCALWKLYLISSKIVKFFAQ